MTNGELSPRVRFAPSPTGYFHVGGARTALYNWLFARRLNGTFVLRIEDTDAERSDAAWTEGILDALTWLGILWDEGPYHQSERKPLYADAARRLFEGGFAYACDCTRAEIEARTKDNATPGYDGFCRDRGLSPGEGRALRFRVPDTGATVVHDLVRGDVVFEHATIDDFVIVKSNGDSLFVLAVVVDDIDMAITHVIRAEEHLPTTPKAILIWEALSGPALPSFAHLPVLVNAQRQKLSKRRDRVAVEDYRVLGYLPEAMRNYLALLGWGPKDGEEVMSIESLTEQFRLEDVNHSPAFFDEKRLAHFNGIYIRALTVREFVLRAMPYLIGENASVPLKLFDGVRFERLAPLVQERVATLGECAAMVEFIFSDPFVIDAPDFEKVIRNNNEAPELIRLALEALSNGDWTATAIRAAVEKIAEDRDEKLAKVQAPIRVATMGRRVGLPLFESLELLGKEITIARLQNALAELQQ